MRTEGEYTFFERDHLFTTPSGASNAVVVAPSNGWVEWKNDKGQTLDSIHRAGPVTFTGESTS